MSKAPKQYPNKPKKDQIKQFPNQQSKPKNFSSPLSSSSSTMGTQYASSPPPPPPPQPPKESFARRYKFIWPLLLTVNLAVGAYLFMRTKKKDTDIEEEVAAAVTVNSAPVTTTVVATAPVTEETLLSPPITQPVKPLEPIPENRQRELFKWILEEKRKANPKDAEEKKRIDEEKAILKQFIRAKSIPSI